MDESGKETRDLQEECKGFTSRIAQFQDFVTEFKETISSYDKQVSNLKAEVNDKISSLKSPDVESKRKTEKLLSDSVQREAELEKFKLQYGLLFCEKSS